MIERPFGVSAYGAASVKSMPDLVRVKFRVVRVDQSPSAAFAAASDVVRAVRQALRQNAVADSGVSRSRLDLASAWRNTNNDRVFVGYRCSAQFSVESTGLDTVQQLLVDIVAAGVNEIDDVEFDVRAKQEMRAEARRKAVKAAREKAELYAEAAGVRLGEVVHIEDTDPDSVRVQTYRSHSSGGQASGEDLAPGHVSVDAAVILGFSITPG